MKYSLKHAFKSYELIITLNVLLQTFGRGQHPYCPEDSLQHVWPVLHWDCPSGHTTFWALNAGIFSNQSVMRLSPLIHFPEDTSHLVFSGQQCLPSLQHTACKTKFAKKIYNFAHSCLFQESCVNINARATQEITFHSGSSGCTNNASFHP